MSFLKAIMAAIVWSAACAYFMSKGVAMSPDAQCITLAIVIAGALAGGDEG